MKLLSFVALLLVATSTNARQQQFVARSAALQLPRGGAGPLDPTTTAKAAGAFLALQGATGYVAPAKTLELYGAPPSEFGTYLSRQIGGAMLVVALGLFGSLEKGMGVTKAVGLGTAMWTLEFTRALVSDDVEKLSMTGFSVLWPTFAALTWALLGDTSYAELAAKFVAVWYGAHGVFMAVNPEANCKIYRGGSEPDGVSVMMMRVFGFYMIMMGIFTGAQTFGTEGVLKAFGYSWLAPLGVSISVNFVTKEIEKFNLDKVPQYIWFVIEAIVLGTLAVEGNGKSPTPVGDAV